MTPLKTLLQNSHQRNVSLMNLIVRWQHEVSFELHIVSKPSLLAEVPGRNEIGLVWHVRAEDESTAVELALSDSLRIDPLLKVLWPSSEWQFVAKGNVQGFIHPFRPQSCLSVHHRTELISPAQPFILDGPSIGFQPEAKHKARIPSCVVLEHVYPWVPSLGEDLSSLMDSLLALPSPRWVVVRIGNELDGTTRRRAMRRLEEGVNACERFLAGIESGQVTSSGQAQAIRNASLNRYAQLSDGSLRGVVLVFAPGEADFVTASLLGQSVTGGHSRPQIESLLEGGFSIQLLDPLVSAQAFHFPEEEPWSAEESAGAFRLPFIADRDDLGLNVKRHRSVELQLPSTPGASAHVLGVNIYRGITRTIGISTKERLHHALYIGATGVGKSTMLLSNMLQDARNGVGFTLIDPPGELADELLARFPKDRAEDLIIVDLEDRDRPVPLNLLAWSTPEERDLIIDTLFTTLLSIYNSVDFFGPVFEQYFRSGLRLLLGDQPSPVSLFTPTLLEFPQVLRNRAFRSYLKTLIKDEEVIDAIEEGEKVYSGEMTLANMAPYINSKFNRFLQDTQLRRIIGHGTMALNFRDAMDSGKIIVFKLAQGRFGKNAADILLAQIVARFRLAAMSRADVPASQRKPYFLYIDECQVLADANISDMLSQCRKYSLGLVLANQYVSQLKDSGVLDAILGNVGTIAAFRVSAEDARLLEPAFSPVIGAQDLVECPNWSGYMRLHSSSNPVRPFSFETLPPDTASSNLDWARQLREESRHRWGVSSEAIDAEIKARREFIKELSRTAPYGNPS
jgi:hypothetical protein